MLDTDISLLDCLYEDRVIFLSTDTKEGSIKEIILHLEELGAIGDSDRLYNAILKREELASTGIGFRFALPHAQLEQGTDFIIGIGIQKGEGIDWSAIDHQKVQVIFLIAGPPNQNQEYLHILGQLTTLLKDVALREALLRVESAQEVIKILGSYNKG